MNLHPLFQRFDNLKDIITGRVRACTYVFDCTRIGEFARVWVFLEILSTFASVRACTRGRCAGGCTFVRVRARERVRVCSFFP